MGMSAAQARLLYITAQLNNLSHQGQSVSDAKVRLSMDTEAIQERYTAALAKTNYYVNSNIFSTTGSTSKSELITLENLKAQNLMVYDGSKVLGYKWEEVDTGKTKKVVNGYHNGDAIHGKMAVPAFGAADATIPARNAESLSAMEAIVANSGLGEDDLETVSYTTKIGGVDTKLNAVSIKSQAGFDAIMEAFANNPAACKQNYLFDLPEGESIDLSKYTWHGIDAFQGVFDGNGTTFKGLNGDSGFFNSLYGVAKNMNIEGATISAETDALGGMTNYLADGASIENCNAKDIDITCGLQPNVNYATGYKPERASVGGLVGLSNGNISGSSVSGTINVPNADKSFGFIGGAIGANINTAKGESTITNTYADVNIVLSNNTDYSNSINGFIGDDSHETTIKNCISMGAITTADGNPINGSDLANVGPCIESDVTNMIALDTRNNNNVLYWASSDAPTFETGSEYATSLGKTSDILVKGDAAYEDQAENQATAVANGIPVLNLKEIQESTLVEKGEKWVDDPNNIIGYEQIADYIDVPEKELQLVPDEEYEGLSSAELEMGLRSGKYQLISPSTSNSTEKLTLNGTDYELVSISSCTTISEAQDEQALSIAEAEYEKDMKKIQTKDKRYEMDQKKIDTEYDALLNEEESIKNVINKNVERSFKTFG